MYPPKLSISKKMLFSGIFISIHFLFGTISLSAQTITTIAGTGATGFSTGTFGGDGGPATAANLYAPGGLLFDGSGNLYFSDSRNHRVRKIDTAGIITTIAGTGAGGYNGDSVPATDADLNGPSGLAFDASGNLYIADAFNCRIRKVSPSGIITTIAGCGGVGFTGDGGPATDAQFWLPDRITFDASGNMYICDWQNNRLRKIDASGIISTIAGNGSITYSGDGGPATAAGVSIGGILFDPAGNILIGDMHNDRIRKIDAAGNITTFAGTGVSGSTGDGGPAASAQLDGPATMIADSAGNIFFTEVGHKIRRISSAGIISAVAGTGIAGFSGDGGPATAAQFYYPSDLAFDPQGNLDVADLWNNRIRQIQFVSLPTAAQNDAISFSSILVYPNPFSGTLVVDGLKYTAAYELHDILGRMVCHGSLCAGSNILSLHDIPDGAYVLSIANKEGGIQVARVVKNN